MKKILAYILNGVLAGVMICIGCAVFLKCEHKEVGAVLFSVALLTICYFGFSLYTGKIGFMVEKAGKDEWSVLLLGLFGNALSTALFGFLLGYALPELKETASELCLKKLDQSFLSTLIRGTFCGILMYVAVATFKEKNTPIGILFCIPVFILSGFEHSIADMGYFAIGGVYSGQAFLYCMTVVLGNTLGGILLPGLKKVGANLLK